MNTEIKTCFLNSFIAQVVKIDYDDPTTFEAAKMLTATTDYRIHVIDGNFMVVLEGKDTTVQVIGNAYVVRTKEGIIMVVTETEFKKMYSEVKP